MGLRVLLTPEALGDTPVFWEVISCERASPRLSFWQLLGPSLWADGSWEQARRSVWAGATAFLETECWCHEKGQDLPRGLTPLGLHSQGLRRPPSVPPCHVASSIYCLTLWLSQGHGALRGYLTSGSLGERNSPRGLASGSYDPASFTPPFILAVPMRPVPVLLSRGWQGTGE